MQGDLEIKLLELTRGTVRISLNQLAEQLHTQPNRLVPKIEDLAQRKLVSYAHGFLQMETAQRMMLATELIHAGRDPQKVTRHLEWQEFERFAAESLEQNGFRTIKHLLFKSQIGKREIDLLAWNDSFLLAIDCKHWQRGLTASLSSRVAGAQFERAEALAGRPEILRRHGVDRIEKRFLMPVILCLSEPRVRIVDGIPIVPISKLISFLYGMSPIDEALKRIPIKPESGQSLLV